MHYEYSEDAPLPPLENVPVGLRNAALAYAHMGLAILPVRPGTKKANPEELGGVGYKVADAGIRNIERINDIYTRKPGSNIAIPTGAPNGILVIDIDRKRGGPDPIKALRKWESETGIELPIGPTAVTPGGGDGKEGMHIYLSLPEGMKPMSCVRSWLPNVDIQCDGGYVLAAPSYCQVRQLATGECPHERESGEACLDDQCEFKYVDGWSQYQWVDMAGDPYSPTPAEWWADLEAAVAPAELIADIRRNGNRRSRPKEIRALSRGTHGTGGGLEEAKWYQANGIPAELAQWDILYFNMTWPLMNAGAEPEQIVAILREALDHPDTHLSRPWEPWNTGDKTDGTSGPSLWAIVNRAFERRQMDGDEYYRAKRDREFAAKWGDVHDLDLFRKNGTKSTAK